MDPLVDDAYGTTGSADGLPPLEGDPPRQKRKKRRPRPRMRHPHQVAMIVGIAVSGGIGVFGFLLSTFAHSQVYQPAAADADTKPLNASTTRRITGELYTARTLTITALVMGIVGVVGASTFTTLLLTGRRPVPQKGAKK